MRPRELALLYPAKTMEGLAPSWTVLQTGASLARPHRQWRRTWGATPKFAGWMSITFYYGPMTGEGAEKDQSRRPALDEPGVRIRSEVGFEVFEAALSRLIAGDSRHNRVVPAGLGPRFAIAEHHAHTSTT